MSFGEAHTKPGNYLSCFMFTRQTNVVRKLTALLVNSEMKTHQIRLSPGHTGLIVSGPKICRPSYECNSVTSNFISALLHLTIQNTIPRDKIKHVSTHLTVARLVGNMNTDKTIQL